MEEIYWTAARNLVDWWANYNAVKKLYYNATHKETYHKVQHVVVSHYGGSVVKVKRREDDLSDCVDASLDRFEIVCEDFGVEPVNRDWLYTYLKEAKDYQSLRGKIDRRLNKGADPVSLKEFV